MTQLKFNHDIHLKLQKEKQTEIETIQKKSLSIAQVEDFFSFNQKPVKQSWWKKLVYGKMNISGCQHNPIVFKFLFFMPFIIYLFINIPYINILGYFLALLFSVKAGISLDRYVKNQGYIKKIIERDYALTVFDWSAISFLMLIISSSF